MNCTEILNGIRLMPVEGQSELSTSYDYEFEEIIHCLNYNISIYTPEERPLTDYKAYQMSESLILYVSPVLLVIGTVGNLLAFIVMSIHASKISSYFYLSVLALLDLFVLYVGLFRLWIAQLTGLDIRDQSDWLCKSVNFFGYTFSDASVWMIIVVTAERYIAVCHPLKVSMLCKSPRCRFIMLFPIFIICLINVHFFWTVELSTSGYKALICDAAPSFEHLVNNVWPWVDAAMYSFLPLAIISILNGFIIQQVCKARRKREQFLQEKQKSKMISQQSKSTEASRRLTLMLLTVSFSFLLTTLPLNITVIVTGFWNNSGQRDMAQLATIALMKVITELLMYVNHSINFFLYCATGKKFRDTLIKIICKRCKCCVPKSSEIVSCRSKYTVRFSLYGTDKTTNHNVI